MIQLLNVDPKLVRACDVSNLERVLGDLAKKPEHSRQLQGSLMLTFEEFERSDQPVFLDPEVKAFLQKAHKQIRHLWYFLVAEPEYNNMLIFFAIHASPGAVMVSDGRVQVNPDRDLLGLLLDRLVATAEFSERMADDTRAIISRITDSLPDPIRQPLLTHILEGNSGVVTTPLQQDIEQQFLGPLESMLLALETNQVPLMVVRGQDQEIFIQQVSPLVGGTVLFSPEQNAASKFQANMAADDHLFLVIKGTLKSDLYDHICYYLQSRDVLKGSEARFRAQFQQPTIHPNHKLILLVDRQVLQSEPTDRQQFLREYCLVITVS